MQCGKSSCFRRSVFSSVTTRTATKSPKLWLESNLEGRRKARGLIKSDTRVSTGSHTRDRNPSVISRFIFFRRQQGVLRLIVFSYFVTYQPIWGKRFSEKCSPYDCLLFRSEMNKFKRRPSFVFTGRRLEWPLRRDPFF